MKQGDTSQLTNQRLLLRPITLTEEEEEEEEKSLI